VNAIEFLKQEHQNAKEKFQEVEQADARERGDLWKQLKPELKIHEHIEDEFLYGPLTKEPKAMGTPLAEFQKRQDEDVAELEKEIGKLEGLDVKSDGWLAQLKKIKSALEDHIMEEESEILPAIPQVWDKAKLDQAGRGMEEEKQRKLQEAATP
jgi:hemerythrin-like domain-containing protein